MRLLAPRREPSLRSLPYRLGLTVLVGLLLVGCGKHYWSKPGAGASDFLRESNDCARENAVQVSASKDYGIVIADLYKVCLKSRGWIRGQQFEPPPAGWFRGIEDDGPMRFEPPRAPSGTRTAALVNYAAAHDRHLGRDVADPILEARHWIVRQHRQIGELAGLDRAFLVLLECDVGPLQGRGP